MNSSSLSRFRMRIDESGCELIEVHGEVGIGHGCVKERRLEACDGGYHGAGEAGEVSDRCEIAEVRERLVKKARAAGLKLRQSYVRVGPCSFSR